MVEGKHETLLIHINNFQKYFDKISLTGELDDFNVVTFITIDSFEFYVRKKLKAELELFDNSNADEEREFSSDDEGIHTRESIALEAKQNTMDYNGGYLSLIFQVKKLYGMENLCGIFTCIVSVLDADGEKRFTQSYCVNLNYMLTLEGEDTIPVVINQYIKCGTLLEKKEELLTEDTLTLLCDISFDYGDKIEGQFETYSVMEDWFAFSESLKKGASFDVLNVKDQKKLAENLANFFWQYLGYISFEHDPACECFDIDLSPWKEKLCRGSSYFEGMFCSGLSESVTGIVSVPRGEYLHFTKMIFSVLRNTLQHVVGVDSLLSLYIIADKYLADGVKTLCVNSIMSCITLENVVPALLLAHKDEEHTLKQKAINFILANWENMIEAFGWGEVKYFEPELYNELLKLHQDSENPHDCHSSSDDKETEIPHSQLMPESDFLESKNETFDFYQ